MNNVKQEQTHLAKLAASEPEKRFSKLYRLICQPEWLRKALDAIRANKGFNTPGTDGIRGEDLEEKQIEQLAEKLRTGTYQPTPVRRVYIPKRNGKLRPLGLPSAEDKVVQNAIKMVLEPIYECVFRDCSHGFRPERSCQTALRAYLRSGTPTWTIEGDLKSYFDTVHHGLLLTILRKKIADERLLELIHRFLKAGYVEDWCWHETWSGVPQGGVLSPLLSNVMLHEFDQYMEDIWGANQPIDYGHASRNPAYNRVNLKVNRLSHRIAKETDPHKRTEMLERLHALQEERKRLPSLKPRKKLTFLRYADDWVLLMYGYSKEEALATKAAIATWLQTQLKLTLNAEKTLITHWREKVKFLGFEVRGIKSHENGARRGPRFIIPHETEERIKHTVAKLTRQSFIDPGDMIDSINLILKGWMNYYCYATNPHRVIARVLHHAFWCLVRYLNKRHKRRGAKKVMKRYYGTVKGKKTLVYTSPVTGQRTSLVRSTGRKSLYRLKSDHRDVDTRKHPWMNYSASVGRSPWQRKEVHLLQQGHCHQCGAAMTEVHHRSALSKKTNASQSGYETTKTGLCHSCHVARTQQQQQSKDQQGKLSTPKGVRSV
ncbi:MAG: group II intron reverse transcriptase/maturase [Ktedonobacteraceae bacterium]|nr:group II intron reverse transcriptase/maturase [Ktedonobacteraceae bacterium]